MEALEGHEVKKHGLCGVVHHHGREPEDAAVEGHVLKALSLGFPEPYSGLVELRGGANDLVGGAVLGIRHEPPEAAVSVVCGPHHACWVGRSLMDEALSVYVQGVHAFAYGSRCSGGRGEEL